jgi:hypothetical protein
MNWKSLFTNLLLVLVSIFLALGLFEVYFRYILPQDLIVPMPALADQELIYKLPANTKAYLKGTSVRWFHLETNSLGLRDSEHELIKAPGTTRVLLLGDSMSMAEGVELAETYIKQFEEKANHQGLSTKIETINAAIRGYGNDQEVVLFERIGIKFQPDLVILAFFEGNDFDDNRRGGIFQLKGRELIKTFPSVETSPKMRYYDQQIRIQNFPGYRLLVGHSHLVNFLRMKYASYLTRKSLQQDIPNQNQPNQNQRENTIDEADWHLTTQILNRWREDCRKIKSIPLILFIPDIKNIRTYKKGETANSKIDKRMNDFAGANNILFVNLADLFIRDPNVESLYLPDGHMSPLGHEKTAAEIIRFLRENKIL